MLKDYKVVGYSGKGVFASVIKAEKDNVVYAVKILRLTLDAMRISGERERQALTLLNHVDPNQSKSIVRLVESFDFNNHLCLVFEALEMNLRETLQKFGKGIGLSIEGVCLYAKQLFTALELIHKLNYIHADLKPDNIMVSKDTKTIKICDFGSAILLSETEMMKTEHLVSPFYRPPEVILGIYPLSGAVDVWSAAATLFELYVGKFMLPATSN